MSELYVRAASWERTDRRTIETLIVPWNEPANVVDVLEDGSLDRYREGFRPGAFDHQVDAGAREPGVVRRVIVKDQHRDGLGKLGHLVALRSGSGGLEGTARILPTKVDDFEAMYEDGIDGISAEFHPSGRAEFVDGVRWRTRAHLVALALEAEPAYASARVVAMRSAESVADEEAAVSAARAARAAELDRWLAEMRDKQASYVR